MLTVSFLFVYVLSLCYFLALYTLHLRILRLLLNKRQRRRRRRYMTDRLSHCSTLCWRCSMKSNRVLMQRTCLLLGSTRPPQFASISAQRCSGVFPPFASRWIRASYNADTHEWLPLAFLSRCELEWSVASLKMYFITLILPVHRIHRHMACTYVTCITKIKEIYSTIMLLQDNYNTARSFSTLCPKKSRPLNILL